MSERGAGVALPQTERQFQAAVVEAARLFGWLVYHTFDSRRSEPGFPDLVMLRGGVLVVAELKADKGRVSRAQEKWLSAWRVHTNQVFVWRPADWPVIERVLR